MADPDPRDYLGDPLSNIARLERRNLLAASTVAFLIAYAGLIPTQISALGLTLPAPSQKAFVIVASLIVGYFMAAFAMSAAADLFIWRKRYYDYLEAVERVMVSWGSEDQENHDEITASLPSITWYYRWSPRVATVRMIFEFVFPLVVGGVAAGSLVVKIFTL